MLIFQRLKELNVENQKISLTRGKTYSRIDSALVDMVVVALTQGRDFVKGHSGKGGESPFLFLQKTLDIKEFLCYTLDSKRETSQQKPKGEEK